MNDNIDLIAAIEILTDDKYYLFKSIDYDVIIKASKIEGETEYFSMSVETRWEDVVIKNYNKCTISYVTGNDYATGVINEVIDNGEGEEPTLNPIIAYYALIWGGRFMAYVIGSENAILKSFEGVPKLGTDKSAALNVFLNEDFSYFTDKRETIKINFVDEGNDNVGVIINYDDTTIEKEGCDLIIGDDASYGHFEKDGNIIISYEFLLSSSFNVTYEDSTYSVSSVPSVERSDAYYIFSKDLTSKFINVVNPNIKRWLSFKKDEETNEISLSSALYNEEIDDYDVTTYEKIRITSDTKDYSSGDVYDSNNVLIFSYKFLEFGGTFYAKFDNDAGFDSYFKSLAYNDLVLQIYLPKYNEETFEYTYSWDILDGNYVILPASLNNGQKIRMKLRILNIDLENTHQFKVGFECDWMRYETEYDILKFISNYNFNNESRYTYVNIYNSKDKLYRRQLTIKQEPTTYNINIPDLEQIADSDVDYVITLNKFNYEEHSYYVECEGGRNSFIITSIEKFLKTEDEDGNEEVEEVSYNNDFNIKINGGSLVIKSYGTPNDYFEEDSDGYKLKNDYYYIITIQHKNDLSSEKKIMLKFDDEEYNIKNIEKIKEVVSSSYTGKLDNPFENNETNEVVEEEVELITPLIEIDTNQPFISTFGENNKIVIEFDNDNLTRTFNVNIVPNDSRILFDCIGDNVIDCFIDGEQTDGNRTYTITVNKNKTNSDNYYKAKIVNGIYPSKYAPFYIKIRGNNS